MILTALGLFSDSVVEVVFAYTSTVVVLTMMNMSNVSFLSDLKGTFKTKAFFGIWSVVVMSSLAFILPFTDDTYSTVVNVTIVVSLTLFAMWRPKHDVTAEDGIAKQGLHFYFLVVALILIIPIVTMSWFDYEIRIIFFFSGVVCYRLSIALLESFGVRLSKIVSWHRWGIWMLLMFSLATLVAMHA